VTVLEYSLIQTRDFTNVTEDEHALLRSLQSGGKHADPS
jgi:hypothetical protein